MTAYTTPTFVTYVHSRLLFFSVRSCDLFCFELVFLLRAICALFTGGVSRNTVLLANVLLRVLFDFDTSVNCYMFCSCGLLGSFPFARHVINSYNALSGRTRYNINHEDCLFLALRNFNALPGCFVNTMARCVRYKQLAIVFVRFRQRLL